MNNTTNPSQQIQEIISKSSTGAVVLPPNPSVDALAAGTALYLGLTKLGKTVSLVSPNPITSDLYATDKATQQLVNEGDNLVVSFPYEDGSIDKVDYNIKDSVFNLIITPRQGFPKLDPSKVQFNYSGGSIDFIITVDIPNLNSLGELYKENQKDFTTSTVINIDRHLVNDFYGKANLVDKTSSSTSQLVLSVLRDLQIDMDKDMATNLYAGVASATNNFTAYSVNAETFETAATLLKFGAVKKVSRPATTPTQPVPMQQPKAFNFAGNQPQAQPQQQQPQNRQPQQQPQRPAPARPMPPQQQQPQMKAPVQPPPPVVEEPQEFEENTGVEPAMNQPQNTDQSQNTPQDWLKPKIFRGSGGLV